VTAQTTSRTALAIFIALALGLAGSSAAQFTTDIVTDGSLPGQSGSAGNVSGAGGVFEIGEPEGYRLGSTLFHSFQQFDVGTGDTALFSANPAFSTDHIIGRVTGGMQSRIDGLLSSNVPGANLFLLNPSGVLFGPNASLDLTGAFHASTADSLAFAGGEIFESELGGSVPILSAVNPGEFGLLGAEAITVQSISFSGAPEIVLRGGRVAVDSGEVAAPRILIEGGRVELGADSLVRSTGGGRSIEILGGDLFLRGRVGQFDTGDGPDVRIEGDFVEISRTEAFDLDAPFVAVNTQSGMGAGGNILIVGDTVIIRNAAVSTRTFAASPFDAGDVTIEARSLELDSGHLLLTGPDASGNAGTARIDVTDTFILRNGGIFASGGDGSGGDIAINAPDLLIDEGSIIQASTFGAGDAGNISLDVNTLRIESGGFINSSVGQAATGQGGAVSIRARDSVHIVGEGELGLDLVSLLLTGEGTTTGIAAITGGAGDAGSIQIDAPEISIENGGVVATFGGGGALGGPGGAAGDVTLRGDRIEILDGGLVDSGSAFKGPGGNISLQANEIVRISGRSAGGVPSRVRSFSAGNDPGGDILVTAPLVEVSEGGAISASTLDLEVFVFALNGGQAGNVTIAADDLLMASGGRIESSSFSQGSGGTIVVDAENQISLSGNDTGIFGQAGSGGDGGSLQLSADRIDVRDGASVSTAATPAIGASAAIFADLTAAGFAFIPGPATGNAGSIALTAADSIALENALISSGSDTFGDGGSLQLNAPEIDLDESSITTLSSGSGNAGRIELNVRDLELHSSRITAEALNAFGGSISINGESIETAPDGTLVAGARPDQQPGNVVRLDDSEIATSVGLGSGDGGNILIRSEFVIFEEDGRVEATAVGGDGGNILLETEFAIAPGGDVTAALDASSQSGVAGAIEVSAPPTNVTGAVTPLDTQFGDAAALLRSSCAARVGRGERSSFQIRPAAGLPVAPDQSQYAFADLPIAPHAPPILRNADTLIRAGRSAEAVAALRSLESDPDLDSATRSDVLRRLAAAQHEAGLYRESLSVLRMAASLAVSVNDGLRLAAARAGLAHAQAGLGDAKASATRTEAVETARGTERETLAALIEIRFANFQASLGNPLLAVQRLERVARASETGSWTRHSARARTDAARLLASRDPAAARRALERAATAIAVLPDDRAKLRIQIHAAKTYAQLSLTSGGPGGADLLAAHSLLSDAIALAESLRATRELSFALGNLGNLYELQNRTREALDLTRRALHAAEHAPDSAFRWHWQRGRLLWATGRASSAMRSYRRAVRQLDQIRPESGSASDGHFQRAIAPVYTAYVDALLRSSARAANAEDAQRLLVEARATTERLKAAELRDYFQDDCVSELAAREIDLDRVSRETGAAIVYPILLPDRIELLVSLPAGIERHITPVSAERVRAEISRFRDSLTRRTSFGYRESARQLYDWLIAPFAERLDALQIETLVFVPDGALRTIPMAALFDGQRHLIERFALAVTPGLSLIEPKPLNAPAAQFLLAGLSQSVQGFEALPNTAREIDTIHSLYGGSVLVDEAFRAERIQSEIAARVPSVVHVATHAVFTGDPATSFVLTYDDRIDMDRLAEVVASTQFRERELELLALSACETAAGDDRAALGLAGVAIRAGARSALGSLWPVLDDATAELFGAFYAELRTPGISKAEALRRAQRLLIADPRYGHPYYWSAFLMINNWL
jgi:filamentous hemagglutinin family protein